MTSSREPRRRDVPGRRAERLVLGAWACHALTVKKRRPLADGAYRRLRVGLSPPSRVVTGDQPDLLEGGKLVPVLAQRADAVVAELGDRGAVQGDPCPGRLRDLAAGEHERPGVRHRD